MAGSCDKSWFLKLVPGFRRLMLLSAVAVLAASSVAAFGALPAVGSTQVGPDPSYPKERLLTNLTSRSHGIAAAAPRFSAPSVTCNSTWNVVASPNSGTGSNALASISFAAANDGWAVGLFLNSSNVFQTLAERWDGSAWTIVSTPNVGAGDNVLESVVAFSPTDAWAVGYSRPDNTSARNSLTEHWDGTTWTVVASPNQVGSNTLFAASGSASNDIWAVGVTGTSTATQISANVLVMHYNGASWSLSTMSPSAHNVDVLFGVRALASNNVWAVGEQQNFTGTSGFPSTALIEHWNGTNWSQATQATDNVAGDFLNDVAGAGTDLWAVGGQVATMTTDTVLTEHSIDGGTTWTAVPGVTPDLSANLFGLAYIAGNNVYAVGASAYSNPSTSSELDHTVIEQWNGTSWSQVTSANPGSSQGLAVIAAISADDVWADGFVGSQTLTENFCTPPTVTNVAPNTGPAVGGTPVVITGTGFTGATAVNFGSTASTSFTVNSDTQITATSPPHPGATVDVTVTVQGTSATSAADQFTYTAPTPAVASVSPTSGPTAGGTSVTITGTGLLFATSVLFGPAAAASITSNTDTQIVAVSPAEAQTTVDVTVTTAGGTSATSPADHFSFIAPAPVVTSISPTAGSPAGGTSVTITGTGLSFATSVMFGTTLAASITSNTDTQIVSVSPAGTIGSTVDVTVTTAGGTSATSPADRFTYTSTWYFNWFDLATPGMVGDNIHLLNTSTSTAHITVSMPGASTISVTLAPGVETHVTFGPGHIGGPVVVTSDQNILTSQRVQFNQSFNEIWGESSAQAALVSYIPWFDNVTAGMTADNIHVVNPGTATAHVVVRLPGKPNQNLTLGPGAEGHVTFPAGSFGGPITITSDQPVLAAQRVLYFGTFNEEAAQPSTSGALKGYFNWFDKASPGMSTDNIHVINVSGTTAHVTISLGSSNVALTIAPLGEAYGTFPAGMIGGPVTVTSDQNVLATQRVLFFQSFNEVPMSVPPSKGAGPPPPLHIMWFDRVTAGMNVDNIHILNWSNATAHVTVTLGGQTQNATVAPGAETYVTFPVGSFGGPVVITTDNPVFAAQRVEYFQTFNEVTAM